MTPPPDSLTGFPVILDVDVAWGDMDSFAHVNNVVYFRYFENARVAYLTQVGWFDLMRDQGLGPIVHSAAARFRRPVRYPDRLWVGARVVTMSPDRVTLEHRAVSQTHDAIVAEGPAVVVCFDYRSNRKAPLPDSLRTAILLRNPELVWEPGPDQSSSSSSG